MARTIAAAEPPSRTMLETVMLSLAAAWTSLMPNNISVPTASTSRGGSGGSSDGLGPTARSPAPGVPAASACALDEARDSANATPEHASSAANRSIPQLWQRSGAPQGFGKFRESGSKKARLAAKVARTINAATPSGWEQSA
jgi:hypothetical protein